MIKKKSLIIYSALIIIIIIIASSLICSLPYDYSGKYAPPTDVFDNKPSFTISQDNFDVTNKASIDITINVTNQGGYVYKTGYYSDFQTGKFIAFDFPQQAIGNTSWIINRVYKTLNIPASALVNGQGNAIIIFSCKKYNGEWKCGCDTPKGPCDQWQIQTFNVLGSANNPCTSNPNSCSPGKECIDGFCVESCTNGQEKTCKLGNCDGTQTCSGGTWASCIKQDPNCKQDPEITGTGTQSNPFVLYNCSQLLSMNNNLVAYYSLGRDIDCSESITWNNGLGFDPILGFTGNFDGEDYSISDLYINRPTEDYVGLFGSGSGKISNVDLINFDITGKSYTGTLAGYFQYDPYLSDGVVSIDMISSSGSVQGVSYVGGLIGSLVYPGSINNSHSSCSVTSTSSYSGGFIGSFSGYVTDFGMDGTSIPSYIGNSYSTGNVNSQGNYVGGLIGSFVGPGAIYNSYSTGNVNSQGDYTGGLAGTLKTAEYVTGWGPYILPIEVYYSYSSSNVNTLKGSSGGLVGSIIHAKIYNSYSKGIIISESSEVGGLIGSSTDSHIENSYSSSNISGTTNIGGLVGYSRIWTPGSIWNSFSTSNITGLSNKGGLIGYALDEQVENSYWNNHASLHPGNPNVCIGYQGSIGSGGYYECTGKTQESYFKTFSSPPLSSWDQSIWAISSSKNNGYPYLKWQNL